MWVVLNDCRMHSSLNTRSIYRPIFLPFGGFAGIVLQDTYGSIPEHGKSIFALHLKDTRDHNKTLALVFVTKLLTVPTLLLGSPAGHLPTTHGNEEQNTPA